MLAAPFSLVTTKQAGRGQRGAEKSVWKGKLQEPMWKKKCEQLCIQTSIVEAGLRACMLSGAKIQLI